MQGLLNQNTIQQILERRATCYYNIMCMNTMAESFTSAGSKTVNEEVINFFAERRHRHLQATTKMPMYIYKQKAKAKKLRHCTARVAIRSKHGAQGQLQSQRTS